MRPIEILDSETINKIAAGEVIERPASALKELLENSADSGATRVEIDFDEGGKTEIRVLDDGHGMDLNELPLSLERHATSKIKSIDDLMSLNTFGFRGEALASLAAVSELSLHSGKKESPSGSKIISYGGKTEGPVPAAPLCGTQVVVKNLFFNVPARQKFLKSDAGETAAIKKTVRSFALSHPELQVTLRQSGRVIYQWGKQDFFKRACQVLNVEPNQALLIEAVESGLKLQAVLVLPQWNLATQQGIWLFVQSRPVVDRIIQQALFEGYRNLMMQHQYPQAVLKLNVDPGSVDVNVHPTKAQVKFLNPSAVFRFISRTVKEALEKKLGAQQNKSSDVIYDTHTQQNLVRDAVVQYNQRAYTAAQEDAVETSRFLAQSSFQNNAPKDNSTDLLNAVMPEAKPKGAWSSLQLIGQYSNTYLVTQSAKALVLIDQHAAHERVLFEGLKNNFQKNNVEKQAALLEELIELPAEAIEAITEARYEKIFNELGFDLAQRGPTTLSIIARPAFLIDVGLAPLFERLGEQILDCGSKGVIDDLLGEIWASMACHGAIRAGRVLSQSEMQSLLNQMDDYSFSSFCPHGRPVSVQLGLHELEKMFKRIV
ncbi:MAG: DNA mismatch repair endonuclease MutL [Oligoflexia bacterium]|nr:DNA mismatch repair endonuclease MutL [Oligoflexia bacterium]